MADANAQPAAANHINEVYEVQQDIINDYIDENDIKTNARVQENSAAGKERGQTRLEQ